MELTLNDFFCGCGGMGIGFIDAGWTIVGAWDFDKFAVQSYKHNVGEHVIQADIKALSWKDIPKATAWAFGFPCQDMSVAGKQKGFRLKCKKCESEWQHTEDDTNSPKCPECGSQEYEAATRSAMFFEMMRLLEETRTNAPENLPSVLVAENVKGLKKYIPVLIEELNKHGYIAHIELYNSKFFDVSQNRERYYIVSTREDLPDTFSMPAKQEDNPVPPLSQFLDKDVDEKYYIPDDRAQKIIEQALQRLEKLGKVHPTITSDRVDKRQNGRRAKEDEAEMFTLTAQDIHGVIIDDTYGYGDTRIYPEQSPTLRSERQGLKVVEESAILRPVRTEHGKEIRKQYEAGEVTEKWSDMRELEPRTALNPDYLTQTDVEKRSELAGGHRQVKIFDATKYRVRKLTPTEYGRLQAFHVDEDWEQVVSDSQAYKQFGNAVTTTVAKTVAGAIGKWIQTIQEV